MKAYDPLDYVNLTRNIVMELFRQPVSPMPPEEAFTGVGVYAIYYTGSLPFYQHLVSADDTQPIYVGKAIPPGGRKGGTNIAELETTTRLYGRLSEHANSIESAENLSNSEFLCRFLTLVPVWITLAERFLIDHYKPLWNTVVDGFGNHDPGRGRRSMRRPRWDILHPGRDWAQRLEPSETVDDILRRIREARA